MKQARILAILLMSASAQALATGCNRESPSESGERRYLGLVKIDEASIRRAAMVKPTPGYPDSSLQAGTQGVAVVSIFTARDGHMNAVDVLEAPDAAIASSVKAAVMNWVLKPVQVSGSTENLQVQGRLTFYFTIADGKGVVLAPEEMPNAAGGGAPGPSQLPVEVHTVTESDLTQPGAVLIDVRERDDFSRQHHQKAINLPLDELGSRARLQLSPNQLVVVDCTASEASSKCEVGVEVLKKLGYRELAMLR